MIVPSAIEKSSGGSKTLDAAGGKLVKIGMDWVDDHTNADGTELVRLVLTTLDQWQWGEYARARVLVRIRLRSPLLTAIAYFRFWPARSSTLISASSALPLARSSGAWRA